MSTKVFTADGNKTVTVNGIVHKLIIPNDIPDGLTVYVNEVEVTPGEEINVTDDVELSFALAVGDVSVTFTASNFSTFEVDDVPKTSPATLTLSPGEHTVEFVGATAIPSVSVNGSGITSFTVNGYEYDPSTDLPFTFTPQGGITNTVFFEGEDTGGRDVTITGNDLESVSVNGVEVALPYTFTVSDSSVISASGEIYQLDIGTQGGVKVTKDGEVITDGSTAFHSVYDVDHDTYLSLDATHVLTVTGEDIKSIKVNGIEYPVESLPVVINNRKMTATVEIVGYEPSEVHVVGSYLDTVTLDGADVPVGDDGSVDVEFVARGENHFINLIGSQPRPYGVTFNDNGATTIEMDGRKQTSGSTTYITKDVYVEATPEPIPVHVEASDDAVIQVNGKRMSGRDFTVNVQSITEMDVTTETCNLTIDYGDGSVSMLLPQRIVSVIAAHRDGWIFDGWSSDDCGISAPKSVKCSVDLSGKSTAHLVCHYQRYATFNKPNMFN